jgi:prevent-host-death family protein
MLRTARGNSIRITSLNVHFNQSNRFYQILQHFMTQFSTVEVRTQLSEVINRVAYGKERVVLTRRGKELVTIVPIEDMKRLELLNKSLNAVDLKQAEE